MTATQVIHTGKKATATRQRVLDAAAKIFAQKGYTGTRLTDIAAAAETQAGSLYYHFASREDLVREVLRAAQQRTNEFVITRIDALPADTSSIDRLRAAISLHLEAVLTIGDYTAATLRILGQVPPEIRRDTIALQRAYGEYWRRLFEDAQADGSLREDLNMNACRMLVIGAMNVSPEWFHAGRPTGLTLEALEEQVSAVFLDGLATPKGRRRRNVEQPVSLNAPPADSEPAKTRAAATTARILDAAAKVFRENGYAGARLMDVATAAEMQTGSLYYHFDSREDLVTHLVRNAWQRTDGVVRRSVDELPVRAAPVNRLAAAMNAHLLSVLSGGDYTSAMLRILGQVPDDVRLTIQPLQREYLALWRTLLREAVEAGDVRSDLDQAVVVMLLTGALNWAVEWYSPEHYMAPEKLAQQFCTLVFDGMATRRAPVTRTRA